MDDILYSRLSDFCAQAERGGEAYSPFLTPAEVARAQKYLRSNYPDAIYRFCGGYCDAERRRLCVLPPWMSYMDDAELDAAAAVCVCAVNIKPSGYVSLSHRDYLGAVLALGLERSHIGDVCVIAESDDVENPQPLYGAVVFCTPAVCDFLCSQENPLVSVGRDRVKVRPCTVPLDFDGGRHFSRVSGTAASMRLDCVTAALCGASREKVKEMIAAGLVTLDYEEALDCDRELSGTEIISVRGFGKYRLECDGSRTKKDRQRINALKYV